MTLYEELVARGLIAQVTDEEQVSELINNGKATFYIGFDPTADSLHVGHFMALMLMRRLQKNGNKPIALIGGGTGMIGDPSGRTDMRQMMTRETIQHNCDFYRLFLDYGCNMQFGGNDQWSNMLGGTELIRKKLKKDAHAMTITLLLTSEGKKMGKTAGGAVWLDPNKTPPYEFYQYWRNVDDADVIKCLKMLTELPLEQIEEMAEWKDAKLNEAKEILAYELTKLVHSEEDALRAQETSRGLFGGAGANANVPTTEITAEDLTDGKADIIKLLVLSGLCSSNGDARRNIQQGGVTADDRKITEIGETFTEEELRNGVVLKRGKKNFRKVILK